MAASSHTNAVSLESEVNIIENVNPMDTNVDVPSGSLNITELTNRLQETYNAVTEFDLRKELLENLVNEDLATRDIFSFVKGQARLRLIDKRMDKKTSRQAMRSKITDLRRSKNRAKTRLKLLEKDLRTSLNNKRHRVRRYLKKLRDKNNLIRKKKKALYRTKIEHYRGIQRDDNACSIYKENIEPTNTPYFLREYSSLSVFETPDKMPKPMRPLGPYICDKKLKISPEELLILQKDPKYSIRSMTTNCEFQVELEKALGKHRYRWGGSRKKDKASDQLEKWLEKESDTPETDDKLKMTMKGRNDTDRKNRLERI